MEKFGIFELLDALSALTAPNEPPETPQNAGRKRDEAFDPPAYGATSEPPQGGGEGGKEDEKESGKDSGALTGFLARHDAVARKAEKK